MSVLPPAAVPRTSCRTAGPPPVSAAPGAAGPGSSSSTGCEGQAPGVATTTSRRERSPVSRSGEALLGPLFSPYTRVTSEDVPDTGSTAQSRPLRTASCSPSQVQGSSASELVLLCGGRPRPHGELVLYAQGNSRTEFHPHGPDCARPNHSGRGSSRPPAARRAAWCQDSRKASEEPRPPPGAPRPREGRLAGDWATFLLKS